jgi:hypothetical protein
MPDGQPPVYDPNDNWQLPGPNGVPVAGSYGGPADSGASGPGFKYDRATLEQLAKDWNDMANEFQDDQREARTIAVTRGPGLEYASGGNADQICKSGAALLAALKEREEYCRDTAAKFEAALGRYATTEDAHTTEIKQTGGTL